MSPPEITYRNPIYGLAPDQLAGFFAGWQNLLEVLPGYRGQGIGSELVRRVLGEIGDLYMVDVSCDEEVSPSTKGSGSSRAGE